MTPTRNNRGVAHENGAIESRHGPISKRLSQALLLRGSASFDDLDAYRAFTAEIVGQHNRRHAAMIDVERVVLLPLPVQPAPLPVQPAMTWEEMTVRVTSASGFMCRHVFYTVPGRLVGRRLVGHRLRLRIHDARIDAYLGGSFLLTMADHAARTPNQGRQRRPRGRLPPHHRRPARQPSSRHCIVLRTPQPSAPSARRAGQPGLSRRAVAARRLAARMGRACQRRLGA